MPAKIMTTNALTLIKGMLSTAVSSTMAKYMLIRVMAAGNAAAKYAPGETAIRVRAWEDGRWLAIQVLDEGPGIPPDDLERVFDSFHRARKRDLVLAGTGLGLSICKGFVEAMGGTITAGNRTDRSGAIFTIRMPIPTDMPKLEDM